MNIVFYTSGITGSGRLVRGISIGNAIRRKGLKCNYSILNSSQFCHLADQFEIQHVEIPIEDEDQLSKKNFERSSLYKTLLTLKPDVLIVDQMWFTLQNFIHDLPGKKIFICHQVADNFFTLPLSNETLYFCPEQYEVILAVEPFHSPIPFDEINPIVLRNRNEIFSRDEALLKLNLDGDRKNCLLAINAHPDDFDAIRNKYSYLENTGYCMTYSSNYRGGIFPVVDYINAFDLIIGVAGYNQFWEVVYFDKEAIFENVKLRFTSTEWRIKYEKKFRKMRFVENGADQLVDIIEKL